MATQKASEGKPVPPERDGVAARKPKAKAADKYIDTPEKDRPEPAPEVVADVQPDEQEPKTDPKDAEIERLKAELYDALVIVHQSNGPEAERALQRARDLKAE